MSIQLKLDNTDFDQAKEDHIKLHFIPASVDETSPANVDEYFNNYTTEVDGCKYSLSQCMCSLFPRKMANHRACTSFIKTCLLLIIFVNKYFNFQLLYSSQKFPAWFSIKWLSIQCA